MNETDGAMLDDTCCMVTTRDKYATVLETWMRKRKWYDSNTGRLLLANWLEYEYNLFDRRRGYERLAT